MMEVKRMSEKDKLYQDAYYLGMKAWEEGKARPELDPEDRFVTEAMQDGWNDRFGGIR